MQRGLFGISLLVAVCLFATPTYGINVTVESYQAETDKEFRELNRIFLAGASSALGVFNSYLRSQKQKPIFCQPSKLSIATEQAEDIMLRWAAKRIIPDVGKIPVSMALLFGLKDTFRCPDESN